MRLAEILDWKGLIVRTYETQITRYTLQETTISYVFYRRTWKFQVFLSVLLTWFTESSFSRFTKNCVIKKITSLTVIFSIYCENCMKHKNTVRIKIQGFFMLQLVVFSFITALHKDKYFLTTFSLDSIL
jgi:hypothetical protein